MSHFLEICHKSNGRIVNYLTFSENGYSIMPKRPAKYTSRELRFFESVLTPPPPLQDEGGEYDDASK